ERLELEGKFKFLDLFTMREEGVPMMLDLVIREADALDARRMVVDSFSALAQAFERPVEARIFLHTLLNKLVKEKRCTTLLIVETPTGVEKIGLGIEEFVADGVIVFLRLEYEQRLLRELHVLKFRGSEISRHMSVFTLKEGFKVFTPISNREIAHPKKFVPIPHSKEYFSSGIEDLDKLIAGRLRAGTYSLVDVGRDVAFPLIRLIRPTIINFISQGHGVAILPPRGVSAPRIREYLVHYIGDEVLKRQVRIADFPQRFDAQTSYILELSGKSLEDDMQKFLSTILELKEAMNKPVLSVVGYDSLEYMYGGEEVLRILGRDIAFTRNNRDLRINIIRPNISVAEHLRAVSDLSLRVEEIYGSIFLWGVKPRTGIYNFDVVHRDGVSAVKFTPVV
ncbi:MAG: ATPase domain-containing protein, partial [Candidatus Bathyarchaeia archaeon]